MATRTGAIGNNDPNNYQTKFKTPQALGIQMETGEYPSGKLVLSDLIAGGPCWRNQNYGTALAVWLYLCDSAGNNKVRIGTWTIAANTSNYTKEFTVTGAEGLAGKALYLVMEDTGYDWDTRDYTVLRYRTAVSVQTAYNNFSIYGIGGQGGNWTANKYTAAPGETITITETPEAGYSAAAPTSSPTLTMTGAGTNKWSFTMPSHDVEITPHFNKINYTISKNVTPSGGGTLTLNRNTATVGDEITITATPATGYRLKTNGLSTSPARTINNNKFTMPASDVTVTAQFEKIDYSISKNTNPSGAGTVTTNKTTANYGDTINVSQTPASGYYFDGWETSPAGLIANGASSFTMPNGNVSITAKYLKYSTANVNKKSVTDGDQIKLTIVPDKQSYSHKYKLSFGTGMETSLTTLAAGTTVAYITLPSGNSSWAKQLPNAKTKSGTLIVETYNGSTKIGTYTITGFTYNVPESALPTMTAITASIVRTINGVTYADIGEYYVQGKCGVRIRTTATGALESTISKIEVSLGGYTGSAYNKTINSNSVDYTTGLLTIAGVIRITAKATDSRGNTVTVTEDITVTAYNPPYGTLSVKRVDALGNDDTLGQYAKYEKTSGFSNIGENALTVTIKAQNVTEVVTDAEGMILPHNTLTFDRLTEYTVQMILQDGFETVTVSAKLPTAQFMLFFGADGTRMALMKAVNNSLGKNGKNGVIELSGDAQVYIGMKMLEEYISQDFAIPSLSAGADLNNLDKGVYYVRNNVTNAPDSWGILINAKLHDAIFQTMFNRRGVFIRDWTGNPQSWGDWNMIAGCKPADRSVVHLELYNSSHVWYWKNGRTVTVSVQYAASDGEIAAWSSKKIATLPEGFRPPQSVRAYGVEDRSADIGTILSVTSAGEVFIQTRYNAFSASGGILQATVTYAIQ